MRFSSIVGCRRLLKYFLSPSSCSSSSCSAFCSSEEDEAMEGGTDSRARTSEVVMECFSLSASIRAKGQ